MNRIAVFIALALFVAPPCFSQTAPADSQTLQAILTELRSIHNDVRLSQTTQILLTELEVQENAVNRATQRRDDLRQRFSQVQSNEKNITQQLAQFDDQASKTIDPAQLKQFTNIESQLKANMATLTQQEKDLTNDLLDADSALRKEQNTLQDIQDQLDSVVKKLQPVPGQ